MKIEQAFPKDYDEIIEVWESSVRATHDFLHDSDVLYYKPLIRNEYLDAVELFCVKRKGIILGFLGLSPGKIEMLFLRPEARGRGIGKMLVRFAIEEKKVDRVDVNEQNREAVGFYNHLGFELIERFPLDPQGKPFPILALALGKRVPG